MIVVDSSAWIAYFNGQATAASTRLFQALRDHEPLVTLDLVLMEVLQGFRSDKEFELARRTLDQVPRLALRKKTHVDAARLFRRLRSRGVHGKTIDCLVAQACIEGGAELLTDDTDFQHIAKHSKLRLA